MRSATALVLIAIAACDNPVAPGRSPVSTDVEVPPTAPVDPADPFVRVSPEDLRPQIDSAYLDCDGDDWFVNVEVTGRTDAMRAVLVRTVGEPLSFELALESVEMPTGTLWEPFRGRLVDPTLPCDKQDVAVVFEALDADGALVDCVATGTSAARLADGGFGDRLRSVPRGDWSSCKIR